MQAPGDNTPPSRSGLKRLITPWEYRHLHASMAARFAGGGFQLGIGLVLLSFAKKAETAAERRKYYWLAAWFLVPAAGNFLGGLLDLSVAGSAPPATEPLRDPGEAAP